ncbi:Uu.00g082250.m01.CDS01 [Anthostomella pinea]|uniref:Uu.00g082250.m01.CDS01 n=1 Tax=Anthostomella pinea TaxID=933095 RepID=A0AAI8VLD0_9PEZI|nr:Uu.00g082250.m01.CDS01 [Anthostomella pinea]
MLSRQLVRHRPRLVTTTTRVSQSASRPRFSSTQPQNRATTVTNVATTGALIAAGWVVNDVYKRDTRAGDKHNAPPAAAAAKTALVTGGGPRIPDLDQLGTSDGQIAYTAPASSEDVTRQLNEHAFSFTGLGSQGVSRYHGAQLASNSPCEDAFVHGSFSSPFKSQEVGRDNKWMAWAVFDGHCGWQLSNLLTTQMMPFVRRALGDAKPPKDGEGPVSEESIHQALKSAFTTLDDALVKSATATIDSNMSFAEKARRLEAAYAGSCALLTLFDPASRNLMVASTGDCRAVLGQMAADGKWESKDLTVDCTGATPSEIARLQAQFPDEPDVVKGGRVWGMQPSRTFGDGMWKWTATLKNRLRWYYNGLSMPSYSRYKNYKDGPYLTAEPLVTTTKISDTQPSFLILSTDGLWDTMSSEDAVDLVGRWIDWQAQGGQKDKQPLKPQTTDTVLGWKHQCQYDEKKATVQDDNAAVHLMRNGLGGGDEEMVRGALTFRYPNSRDIRDDMTVQVVFFSPKSA